MHHFGPAMCMVAEVNSGDLGDRITDELWMVKSPASCSRPSVNVIVLSTSDTDLLFLNHAHRIQHFDTHCNPQLILLTISSELNYQHFN